MAEPEVTYFYLFPADGQPPFPRDWHRLLKPEGIVIVPERVFFRRRMVNVEVPGEMTFDLIAAGIDTQLPKGRPHRFVKMGPNATYYWDDYDGFLEMPRGKDSDPNLSLAIQVFGMLVRRAQYPRDEPFLVFLHEKQPGQGRASEHE